MIVVTGAAGFIGCNIIKGLNALGRFDILAVDDLSDGHKFHNLAVCKIADYMDCDEFLAWVQAGKTFPNKIEAIFHEGACSTTTEWNGRYIMKNNYEYTKQLLHYCLDRKIAFLYASSAAVYGADLNFDDRAQQQLPLNVYGYSKWQFDQYVQPYLQDAASQVVGFRYFNVYGPHEQHKASMASVAFHLMNQLRDNGVVKLFEGCEGYADGEQVRDFVCVDDVVKVNLWFWQHPELRGIFNLGTGQAKPFNDIAKILIKLHGSGELEYIPFPDHLKGVYQSYTQANIAKLREVGYDAAFDTLEQGLKKYYQWYKQQHSIKSPIPS
ncbi:MAG: ADP-glyceromanno-heptose 6-epimerase [Gammaproteobacteria bacterium]|nr:ADP-glyceromanno-heptose 6-epimerase [Gammaproteobacteria bacterium]MCH9744880.1 ADP-glyceromanno-heptose 6-epimerase [Gammaproteobacteria bacterium]